MAEPEPRAQTENFPWAPAREHGKFYKPRAPSPEPQAPSPEPKTEPSLPNTASITTSEEEGWGGGGDSRN